MKADALPLTKLYDTLNKAYVIPSYQRPFAWGEAKAIDLLDAILEGANAQSKLTSVGTFLFCNVPYAPGHHPFGNNAPLSGAPNTVWEVVDGQQRLTVLSIIGFILKERLMALTAAGLAYSPPLEFDQLFTTSRTKTGKPVPILIRDEDNFDSGYKSDIALLLNAFAGNQPHPTTVGTRLSASVMAVRNWVGGNLDASNFQQFCDYLLSNCQYIQVEADDQDTAFTMFEPLNSTSEPLTAFEVYRSRVVRTIQPAPTFSNTYALLDYDNRKRDEVIRRSNTLVFGLAQVFSGERPRMHFVQLKQYLDKHVQQGFVTRLEEGADFLNTIWFDQTALQPWFDEETKNCIRFLKASNHDVALPILLRYFQTNPTDVPAVARSIVAFYSLWRPAFPTNSLPDIYRNLLTIGEPDNMALDGGTLKTAKNLAAYFRGKLEAKLGSPPSGHTFEDLWIDDSRLVFLNYEEMRTICRLFIFLDIGASIKSNLVPNDPWTDLDDIEHILAASTQPTPKNIHHIGNLTFLPPKVNKSIQAMPWKDKKEIYGFLAATQKITPPISRFADGRLLPTAVQTYLADANSPALVHLQMPTLQSSWGEPEIKTRTTAMLKNVWSVLYKKWL
jgi:Protein of unknown function DUF262/Protein of unknown function (DUF1524)